MSEIESKIRGASSAPFMADFQPLSALWNGPQAPYPSEYSARWAVRKLGEDLVKSKAVALHRGRYMVHPQRFAEVAEKAALAEFSNRLSHG
jgi:hypothetical protein